MNMFIPNYRLDRFLILPPYVDFRDPNQRSPWDESQVGLSNARLNDLLDPGLFSYIPAGSPWFDAGARAAQAAAHNNWPLT